MMKRRILVDFNHLMMRNLHMHLPTITKLNAGNENDGWQYLRYNITRSLFSIMKKFKPDEYVVCTDGRNNWRKRYYPEYKANRKVDREKSTIDWDSVYCVINSLIGEIKENYPYKVLGEDNLEADDTIAYMCKKHNDIENIIVSSDKDLFQLLKYKNVKQWDPIKKIMIKLADPITYLKEKVLTGDSGDNVPAIRPRLGIKTAEKIVSDIELYNKTISEHTKEYERNRILIDLDNTPSEFTDIIEYKYNCYTFERTDNKHLYNFFSSTKFKTFLDEIDSLCVNFKKLYGISTKETSSDALF